MVFGRSGWLVTAKLTVSVERGAGKYCAADIRRSITYLAATCTLASVPRLWNGLHYGGNSIAASLSQWSHRQACWLRFPSTADVAPHPPGCAHSHLCITAFPHLLNSTWIWGILGLSTTWLQHA